MHIDIQTAAIFSILVNVLQFIITLVYAGVVRQYRGLRYLALWYITFAAGNAVWLMRGPVPPWVAIVFGNALQVLAGCFLYTGTSLFVKNRRAPAWLIALPVYMLLPLGYFTLFDNNIVMRTVLMSLYGCAITWATAWLILRLPIRPLLVSYRFTLVLFLTYGLTFVIRATVVPFQTSQPSPFAPTFAQLLLFLLEPVFGLLLMVGFGLMITQRLLGELQSSATALEQEHLRMKTMLETVAVGVYACDNAGHFTVVNQMARNYHGWQESDLSLDRINANYPIYHPDEQTPMRLEERPLYRALQGEEVRGVECVLKSLQGEARTFLVNASPLVNPLGQQWGGIAVFTEITEGKKAAEAQAQLLAELQQAIGEIKQLRGLIPICAHCKSVRDDKGFWQQVEAYVSKHTEAEFSHSICPNCFDKHYPGIKKPPAWRPPED